MTIEAIGAIGADQSRVDAAYQRLAAALAADKPAGSTSPDEVERGHSAVGAARVALAQAEAAANASEAVQRQQAEETVPPEAPASVVALTV